MKRVRHFISLLLLLTWLPCTAHCQIESLGFFGAGADCCERSGPDSDTPSDCHKCEVCQSVESGGYFVAKYAAIVPVLCLLVSELFSADLPLPLLVRSPSVSDSDSRPVFLATSWQFDLRTSAPPRAPSFAS